MLRSTQTHQTLQSTLEAARTFPSREIHVATTRPLTALHDSYPSGAPRLLTAWGARALVPIPWDHHRSAPSHPSRVYSRHRHDGGFVIASAGTSSGEIWRPRGDFRRVTCKKARHRTARRIIASSGDFVQTASYSPPPLPITIASPPSSNRKPARKQTQSQIHHRSPPVGHHAIGSTPTGANQHTPRSLPSPLPPSPKGL